MHVVVAGASGFLGSHLVTRLREHGHRVTTLVRRTAGPEEVTWDPYGGPLDPALLAGVHVVVNLAGSPTMGNPHSGRWRRNLLESRVTTTSRLAEAVAAQERPPAFVAGNGISYYGDHAAAVVTEESDSRGDGLMTRVTRDWQAAAAPAVDAGARVCFLRTAPVMDRESQPLAAMAMAWKLGLGTRIGSGEQYFPIISLRDWVGAVTYLVESHDVSGAFNLCCPHTPTNAEFTRALADACHRKAFLAVPGALVKVGAGALAAEVLGSMRVRPDALERAGYDFDDSDVTEVLAAGLAGARS